MYGLHPNAEIGFLTVTSERLFRTVLEMQPKESDAGGGAGVSREEKASAASASAQRTRRCKGHKGGARGGQGHPRSLQRRRAELQGQHSHRLHAASLAPGSGQLSAHKLDAPPRFYLSVFALGLCDHIREHTVQLQEAAVVREVTRIGRDVPKAKRGSHAASSTA